MLALRIRRWRAVFLEPDDFPLKVDVVPPVALSVAVRELRDLRLGHFSEALGEMARREGQGAGGAAGDAAGGCEVAGWLAETAWAG